ncbi:DUF421 domain-containing protein [Phaeobacter gallaeciensis]|uniref:Membrane protein n=1 Tax=Phaeobacter gallaeciensis TaxID=60890 RepID=A0AAC9ZA79_9RHOB|nr:YetF domain-containing protein [Phaeobacter gallaeciensis]AHD10124.1 putative membrane protein [Phaeobacter gallaeciensis DSM 26640]ATE93388.1 putative membrane protein [Phaeobacter gallaeciensis]ATE96791.1 putative membrane protein [Phaeobacter gallaeciensis]ATF02052.1 putative membrane protein [Phaeobacter gallaeciensis]ATF06432.1 putative membrane protein [Phaeobacter gallaeciensis]
MFVEDILSDFLLRSALLSSIGIVWVIVVVRLVGLRAFSKMTAFDFVVTVAIGSLLAGASQATSWTSFGQSALSIGTLLCVQYVVARLRQSSERFKAAVQNTPVMLMRDGDILYGALAATRVSEDDLMAKLREANVLSFSQVRAVVLETTGDISVLHGDALESRLIAGVEVPS